MKATKVVACCVLTAGVAWGVGHLCGTMEWSELRPFIQLVGAVALAVSFIVSIWILAE